jgi:hypothetical protein
VSCSKEVIVTADEATTGPHEDEGGNSADDDEDAASGHDGWSDPELANPTAELGMGAMVVASSGGQLSVLRRRASSAPHSASSKGMAIMICNVCGCKSCDKDCRANFTSGHSLKFHDFPMVGQAQGEV